VTRVALSREAFVDAALELISASGVEQLSMRKVAAHLGVSSMAAYKHFASKDELLVAALDTFIARADVLPAADLPWAQWLEQVALRMYRALSQERSWVSLLGSLPLGDQAAAVTDAVMQRLVAEGFSTEQAMAAYFSMLQLVAGSVCLHASLRSQLPGNESSALSPLTSRYLQSANTLRLQVAPALEHAVQQEPIALSLPLLLAALQQQLQLQLQV
jgi:AcrR family transcriptional regulator